MESHSGEEPVTYTFDATCLQISEEWLADMEDEPDETEEPAADGSEVN